jgi:uncharacterized protein involved in exopolysaccharide biosynthesis/Mrp family chromosome partitioning ATPase
VWAVVLILLVTLPSSYIATGIISIAEPGKVFGTVGINIGDPADMESQVYIAESPAVLKRVVKIPEALEAMKEECKASINFGDREGDCDRFNIDSLAAIEYLKSRYSVNGAGRSRILSISYYSSNPETAKVMANALIDGILDYHREEITRVGISTIASLSEQLEKLDLEIRRQSAEIQIDRNKNSLVRGARGTVTSERLTEILEQVAQAEADRLKATAIVEAIKKGNLDDASVLSAVMDNRVIGDIKQQIAAARVEERSAAESLGPLHPQRQILATRVDMLESSLRKEIAQIERNARKQLVIADSVLGALRSELRAAETRAADANTAEVGIEDKVRQLDANKQHYIALFVQKEKLEADTLSSPGRLRLVSKADLPVERFFPKTVPFVAAGFALALVLAVMITLTRDQLARGISNREKLQPKPAEPHAQPALRKIAMLQIPNLPRADPVGKAKAAVQDPRLRRVLLGILRDLLSQRPSNRPLAVAMLSVSPCEERALTTLMLAICASDMGYKVLIVDANIYPSRRTQRFAGALGLNDILERGVAPNAVLQRVQGKLDAIGSGRDASDPTRLLNERGLASLIAWARDYDLVLFDSPPLDQSMNAGLLAEQVDGSLFCSTCDAQELEATVSVAQRLGKLGLNIVGYLTADSAGESTTVADYDSIEQRTGLHRR